MARPYGFPAGGPHYAGGLNIMYRGTSLTRNSPPLGPYSRTKPRALWWSKGGGGVL